MVKIASKSIRKLLLIALSMSLFLVACSEEGNNDELDLIQPVDGFYLPDTISGLVFADFYDSTYCFIMHDNFVSPHDNYALAGSGANGYIKRISNWFTQDEYCFIETQSVSADCIFRSISYTDDMRIDFDEDDFVFDSIFAMTDGFLINDKSITSSDVSDVKLSTRVVMVPSYAFSFNIENHEFEYFHNELNTSLDIISSLNIVSLDSVCDSIYMDVIEAEKVFILDSIYLIPIIANIEYDFSILVKYNISEPGSVQCALTSDGQLRSGGRFNMGRWFDQEYNYMEYDVQAPKWTGFNRFDIHIVLLLESILSIDNMKISTANIRSDYRFIASGDSLDFDYSVINSFDNHCHIHKEFLPLYFEEFINSGGSLCDTILCSP